MEKIVEVTMEVTESELKQYIAGKPCETFLPDCPVCMHWKKWRETGKATIEFHREGLLALKAVQDEKVTQALVSFLAVGGPH